MKKVDLVLWTKNGEKTLGCVLDRINHVIPKEAVNERFIVDDHSIDSTVTIAWSHGWNTILNEGHGISDGANTALKHVSTDFFCSFEQDVLLSPYWWRRVSRVIQNPSVAAVCGLRFFPKDNLFYSLEPYAETQRNKDSVDGFGKSLDNTIWRTSVLRGLGGFPKLKYAGADSYLWRLINAKGFKWIVDYDVQSLHLHQGFFRELKKHYFYGRSMLELESKVASFRNDYFENGFDLLIKFLKSPIAGLKMSLKMHDARLMLTYPCAKLFWFLGYLRGKNL